MDRFFLPYLPQFEEYDKKWEYIMSIKKITPLKDAEISFKEACENKTLILDLFSRAELD